MNNCPHCKRVLSVWIEVGCAIVIGASVAFCIVMTSDQSIQRAARAGQQSFARSMALETQANLQRILDAIREEKR